MPSPPTVDKTGRLREDGYAWELLSQQWRREAGLEDGGKGGLDGQNQV